MLARGLKELGHEIDVVALNRLGHFASELERAGVPVRCLGKRFRFDPLTWWRLRQHLREQNPEIVHSFLFAANSYIRLPGVSPPDSLKVVSERCVDSWKSGWQVKIDRWLKKRMHAMTANSQPVADFYSNILKLNRDNIAVIPNGFEQSPPGDADLRTTLGLSADAQVIGFVGRLAPQKCLKDLMWAFQLIRQVNENVYLVLIGEGPDRDALAELATTFGCRNRVFFMGHRNDAANLTAQFDVFCLPSAFEGMSNSLMEAMAAGVASVVSDIDANLQLIEHETTGLTFPHSNGPDCARALRRLLDDNELRSRLGTAAAEKIRTDHSPATMIERHIELYRSINENK